MRFLLILLFCLPVSAATITVPANGDLQGAINTAQPGDVIVLGGKVVCSCILPNKPGATYITIQGGSVESLHPSEPAFTSAPYSHHWKLTGIDISPNPNGQAYDVVKLGDQAQTLAEVPHDFIVDNCNIHGSPTQDVQRGIGLNGASITVTNNRIYDIHGVGYDSQAIAGFWGPGPFFILDNYLEAAGENILFGGSDPKIAGLIPSNIEIRRNHLFKPLSWKVGDPSYAGKHWTIKNLLELKNAKNVVIDGNVLENNWVDGQTGIPVLFTVRNQDCTAPWSTVQNVTFTNNTLVNTLGGINLLGKDNEAEPTYEDRPGHAKCSDPGETFGSVRGTDVTIANNLFHDIKSEPFLTINGFYNVTLSRNTHVQANNLMTLYGEQSLGFKYLNNLTTDHDYGINGDGGTTGTAALNKYTPGWVMTGNVIANPYGTYPTGNTYPATLILPPDYRSPYPGVGADIDALNAAQGSGPTIPTPSPTPSPTPIATPTPVPTPKPSPSPVQPPVKACAVGQWCYWNWPSAQADKLKSLDNAVAYGCDPNSVMQTGSYFYCFRVR